MGSVQPRRQVVVAAVVCAVWAVASLAPEGVHPRILVGVLLGAAVLPARRLPVLAGIGVAAVMVVGRYLEIPADNPWDLAAAVTVLFAAGRHARSPSNLVPTVAIWAAVVAQDPTPPTAVFGVVLAAAPWLLGLEVRRRAAQAQQATELAAALAEIDVDQRAAQAVAEERARLAGDVLAVIRTAVVVMRRHAEQAHAQLDPDALAAIQDEGRRATSELRRLLGLLRGEDAGEERADPPGVTAEITRSRRRAWRRLLVGASLLTLLLVEATVDALERGHTLAMSEMAASGALLGSLALRRRQPALACLAAALVPGLALAFDLALPYGLWSGVVVALLAWSATGAGAAAKDWRSYAALGLLGALLVLDVHRHAPGNEAITLVTLAFAGIIGHVWSGRAGVERAAHTTAATLRAQHDAAADLALRAERLRVARELHDVTSHAVGVMVLQAGAATALREQDPERARQAVGIIRSTGTEALAQLEVLLQLLDEGAVGTAGVAVSGPVDELAGALESLVARMGAAGLQANLAMGGLPEEPQMRATIHRLVQESLTNAMRHAPGSRVDVVVRGTGEGWEVTVHDDGPGGVGTGAPSGGFGLVGLTERVEALGGELTAGIDPAGGFTLRAFLPVDRPVESRS